MSKRDTAILEEIQKRGFNASDVNLDDCKVCDKCSTILLPDDECYSEFETNKALCAECCFYDEYLNSYVRGTIESSHLRLRVQLDVA